MVNKNIFFVHQAQTSPHPIAIQITKAEGVYLYDESGKRYFDLISGLAVNNVGHSHPKIVEAVKNQAEKFMHVMPYGEFIQEPQIKLAEKLAHILPSTLSSSYFVNSGAEAVEGALKLAKRYTGRKKNVACNKSYHGSTHGALSVTGNDTKRKGYGDFLPNISFISFNEISDLDSIDEFTAAVIVETIQGDAGVRIPDKQYMLKLRERCTEVGALLILDEIQTGYGRTGTFFAFEQYNIVPDILCIAKAMAGGMPMGAFVSSKSMMSCLSHDPMLGHITTFGGHPVSCIAAYETIDIIQEHLPRVKEKGVLIKEMLSTHKLVKEIRQIGLMLAIDLPSQEITQQVVHKCLEKGVITFWFLSCPASFRLAPPLTITINEIKESIGVILTVFDEVTS